MAKQIIHKLVDDLDGGDAEETVKFALDGIQYEIDLSEENAARLVNVVLEQPIQIGASISFVANASSVTAPRVGVNPPPGSRG